MSTRITPESTTPETVTLPEWAVNAIAGAADLSEKARRDLVVTLMLEHSDFSQTIGAAIVNAPTGPTPAETLTEHVAGLVDRLAAFVLAARPHDCQSDVPTLFAAAMSRVQPDTAGVEKVLAGASGRTRRTIVRNFSGAAGDYRSEKGNKVRVTVDSDGIPTFWHGRKSFATPTGATKSADWNGEKGNWGNPFEKWTDSAGLSLADRAPEVPTPAA